MVQHVTPQQKSGSRTHANDLKRRVKDLEAENAELHGENARLRARVAKLQQQQGSRAS